MSENDVLVGFLCLNDEPCEVYVNPNTGEVYYVDEQGVPFLIMGIDHTRADLEKDEAAANGEDPIAASGIVYDGDYKWVIDVSGETASKVSADAIDLSDVKETVDVDFDNEYADE